MSPAPFQTMTLFPRIRALDRERASLVLVTLAWAAVYLGALASPEHRLSWPWLLCAVAAALGHALLAAESREAPGAAWLEALVVASWSGWLLPVLGLKPLWPMAALSVVAVVGRLLADASPGERSTVPAGAPAIESRGGRVRQVVVVAWVAVAALVTWTEGAGATYDLLLTSGACIAASFAVRGRSRKVRALFVIGAAGAAICVAGTALLVAYGLTRDPEIVARASALAAMGLASGGALAWRAHRALEVDLRVALTRGLALAAAATAVAFYAVLPRGLAEGLTPELLAQYTPLAVRWVLLGFSANVAGLVVLLGLRSAGDGRWLRARLRLDALDLRTAALMALAGMGCAAIATVANELLRPLVGAPAHVPGPQVSPWLAQAVVLGVAAVWEEVVFRGVLQPRIGAWASGGLFVAAHAGQYDALGLWCVLPLALVVTAAARRAGTVAAILAHLAYNASILLIAFARS